MTNITDTPFSGAQKGYAISQLNSDGATRRLHVHNSLLHNFQKAGMQVSAVGPDSGGT